MGGATLAVLAERMGDAEFFAGIGGKELGDQRVWNVREEPLALEAGGGCPPALPSAAVEAAALG